MRLQTNSGFKNGSMYDFFFQNSLSKDARRIKRGKKNHFSHLWLKKISSLTVKVFKVVKFQEK